jgi:hypothetical protein
VEGTNVDFLKMIGIRSKNGSTTAPSKNGSPEKEESESELSTDEIINVRNRLKRKATEPVIPQEVRERMDADMDAASAEGSESSRAVQTTLCQINKELDARCEEVEEEAEKEAPA